MILTKDSISILDNILKIFKIGDIEHFMVLGNFCSGVSEQKDCIILADGCGINFIENETPLKFMVSRPADLAARLDLYKKDEKLTINAQVIKKQDITFITELQIKGSSGKCSFRAGADKGKKFPSTINFTLDRTVKITAAELTHIWAGVKLMKAKEIVLGIDKNGKVSFEATDEVNDIFSSTVESFAVNITENMMPTVYKYSMEQLFAFMKYLLGNGDSAELHFDNNGTLRLQLDYFNIFFIPNN